MHSLPQESHDIFVESPEPNERQLVVFMLKRMETHLEEDIRWLETNHHSLFKITNASTYQNLVSTDETNKVLFLGRSPGFVSPELVGLLLSFQKERFPGINRTYGVNYLCALVQELSLLESFTTLHHEVSPKIFRVLTRDRIQLVRDAMKFHLLFFYNTYVAGKEAPPDSKMGYFVVVNPYKPLIKGVAYATDGNVTNVDVPQEKIDEILFILDETESVSLH